MKLHHAHLGLALMLCGTMAGCRRPPPEPSKKSDVVWIQIPKPVINVAHQVEEEWDLREALVRDYFSKRKAERPQDTQTGYVLLLATQKIPGPPATPRVTASEPPREFFKRFEGFEPTIKRGGLFDRTVSDPDTPLGARRAQCLGLEAIEWRSATWAQIAVRIWAGTAQEKRAIYQLTKAEGHWRVNELPLLATPH